MLETIQSVPLTFYSKSFYSSLVRQGRGFGGGFILLAILLGIIGFIPETLATHTKYKEVIPSFFDQLPSGKLQDGRVTIDQPSPLFIKVIPNLDVEIDADFTNDESFDILEKMNRDKVKLLVTANAIGILKPDKTVEITKLTKDMSYDPIDHKGWVQLGHEAEHSLMAIIIASMIVGVALMVAVAVLLSAVLVAVFSMIMKVQTDFPACMRLAAAASIPIAIVAIFLPVPSPISFVVRLAFCVFGLFAVRAASVPPVTPKPDMTSRL